MVKGFKLIKCKAVSELLYLYDIEEGIGCKVIPFGNYSCYYISNRNYYARLIYNLTRDINIYIPSKGIYLSGYILAKKHPTPAIYDLLNSLTIDGMFGPYFSQQRIIRGTLPEGGSRNTPG